MYPPLLGGELQKSGHLNGKTIILRYCDILMMLYYAFVLDIATIQRSKSSNVRRHTDRLKKYRVFITHTFAQGKKIRSKLKQYIAITVYRPMDREISISVPLGKL